MSYALLHAHYDKNIKNLRYAFRKTQAARRSKNAGSMEPINLIAVIYNKQKKPNKVISNMTIRFLDHSSNLLYKQNSEGNLTTEVRTHTKKLAALLLYVKCKMARFFFFFFEPFVVFFYLQVWWNFCIRASSLRAHPSSRTYFPSIALVNIFFITIPVWKPRLIKGWRRKHGNFRGFTGFWWSSVLYENYEVLPKSWKAYIDTDS